MPCLILDSRQNNRRYHRAWSCSYAMLDFGFKAKQPMSVEAAITGYAMLDFGFKAKQPLEW